MSDLIQQIVDGKIPESTATTTTASKTNTRGTTNLGHDAFLQLLICEMQNQDPLEPTTNTEWIAQLATFSQLEELQSLSQVTENSQLFSLVGKQVIVKTESASGGLILKTGTVDFITLSGGVAKFSVDGSLYTLDDLYSIVDEDYLYDQNKPRVMQEVRFKFNGDEPEDLTFKIFMGEEPANATDIAIIVGNAILSPDYVIVDGDTVTIKQEILQELEPGTYKFSVVFNDERLTTVDDMITVEIYNSHPTVTDPEVPEDSENTDTTDTSDDSDTQEVPETD